MKFLSRNPFSKSKNPQLLILVIILVAIFLLFGLLTKGKIFELHSLQAIAFQLPLLGLLTLAQMSPMLTGGIDLSIVSTANLSAIIIALSMTQLNFSPFLAIILGLVLSLGLGVLKGTLVAFCSIPAMIATLGLMIFIRGVALVITKGYVIAGFPQSFLFLGDGTILGIPMPFIIFLIAAAFMSLILNRTPFGIQLYLLGSNPTATLFSGVNNKRVIFRVYLLCSFLAGVASIVMTARFNAAQAGYGESYLLLTVLACVLGGVNPSGGFGKVGGLILSMVVLQVVATGFNLLGLSSHLASALWGIILVSVILTNRLIFARET